MQRLKIMLMQLKAEFDFRREVRRKLDALTNHGLIDNLWDDLQPGGYLSLRRAAKNLQAFGRMMRAKTIPVKSRSRSYRIRVRII